jgi:hypothetical protein
MSTQTPTGLTDEDIQTVWPEAGDAGSRPVTASAGPQDADGTDTGDDADGTDADGRDGDATDGTDGDSGDDADAQDA